MEEERKQNGILLKKETLKGNAKRYHPYISIPIINIITNIKATPLPNMYRYKYCVYNINQDSTKGLVSRH